MRIFKIFTFEKTMNIWTILNDNGKVFYQIKLNNIEKKKKSVASIEKAIDFFLFMHFIF